MGSLINVRSLIDVSKGLQTDSFRKCSTSFNVALTQTVRMFVCEFITLDIMESVPTFHDNNFCKSLPRARQPHSTQAHVWLGLDACALEPRRRFVTDRGIKKKKAKI